MKFKTILELAHRLIGFTLFESLISVIGLVGIYNSIVLLTSLGEMNILSMFTLISASLCIGYLSAVNILYWFADVNLLDYNKWYVEEEKQNGSR